MKLLHVEGPGYTKKDTGQAGLDHGGVPILASMLNNPDSPAGVHVRLVSNLIHFIRNAPNSTHMVAVVDGQARRTYEYLRQILNKYLIDLYPQHAQAFFEIYDELALWEHISMERMLGEVPKINSHASRFNVLSKQKLKHPNSHLK